MGWRLRHALSSPRMRAALRVELLGELARPAELGLPWPEAIAESASDHSSGTVRSALSEIAPRLAEGEPLSEALRGLEALAGAEARPVLRAAERAGRVPEALAELERSSARSEVDAARLREGWLGPAVTLVLAVGVLGVLATSFLPALRVLASDPPPLALRLLPRSGLSMESWAWLWLAFGLFTLASPRLAGLLPAADRWLGRLPFWGPLRRSATSILVTRSLARLLAADVGLGEALESTAEVLPPGAARGELRGAAALLAGGTPAREAFGAPGGDLPPVLRAVLASADGDAALAPGLLRLADFEEAELERRAARAALVSAMAGLAVAGLFAGFVVMLGWTAYFDALASSPF